MSRVTSAELNAKMPPATAGAGLRSALSDEVPVSVEDIQPLVRVAEAVQETGYKFVTITPASHKLINSRSGNAVASSLTDIFGWSRPFSRDVLPPILFDLLRQADLLDQEGALWRSKVRFSTLNDDLFMHSAFPTSARNAVFFGPDTYKFVDAIDACLSRRSDPVTRAADVCAGAGPGGLAIARRVPDAAVSMLDINPEALRYARVNALLAGLANAEAKHSDLLSGVSGLFDLIVAHPPYLIDRDTRAYRHGGGPLGASLSLAVVRAAMARLAPAGTLLLFTGIAMTDGTDPFLAEIKSWLQTPEWEWSYREVDPDVFGEELAYDPYRQTDRIALVVLTATKRAPC